MFQSVEALPAEARPRGYFNFGHRAPSRAGSSNVFLLDHGLYGSVNRFSNL